MIVTLRYFNDCPNWRTMDQRLKDALRAAGHDTVSINYERVETHDEAERLGFIGSPTVLIDDNDPFASPGAPIGLACRLYPTQAGLAGSPTIEQLTEAVRVEPGGVQAGGLRGGQAF